MAQVQGDGDAPPPGKPARMLQTAWTMRRLIAVLFLYPLMTSFLGDIMASFLRTAVSCPLPEPKDGKCPDGSFFQDGHCEPEPRGSKHWSLSGYCADKGVVVRAGTTVHGNVLIIQQVGILFGTAVVGSQIDAWGRKPGLMLSFSGWFVCSLLLVASTLLPGQSERVWAVVLAALSCSVTNVFNPTCRAIVADLTEGDTAHRSAGFAVMQVLTALGALSAIAPSTEILSLDLTDYTFVWVGYAVLCGILIVVVAIVTEETLPRLVTLPSPDAHTVWPSFSIREEEESDEREDEDGDEEASNPSIRDFQPDREFELHGITEGDSEDDTEDTDDTFTDAKGTPKGSCPVLCGMLAEIGRAAALVWRDPFIGNIIGVGTVIQFVYTGISMSINSYLLEGLKYTQMKTQIPGAVGPVVGLLGSAMSPLLVRLFGPMLAGSLAILLSTLSFVAMGLGSYYQDRVGEALFWPGFVVMNAVIAVIRICLLSLTSVRVDLDSQGKLDAMSVLVMTSGGTLGTFLWSHFFPYSSRHKGRMFWAAGGGMFFATAWFVAACLVQGRKPFKLNGLKRFASGEVVRQ